MKTIKYLAIALTFSLLTACDSTSSSTGPSASDSTSSSTGPSASNYTWNGHIDIRKLGSDAHVSVAVGDRSFQVDAQGNYTISLPKSAARVSARAMADSIIDTAKLIVQHGGTLDTLKEIPLKSWTKTLDSTSIVATSIEVKTSAFAGKMLEAVWWNSDSVAHVKQVRSIVNDPTYFSGKLYSTYDAHSDLTGDVKAWIFLRFKDSAKQNVPTAATTVYGLSEGNDLTNRSDAYFHVPSQLDTTTNIRVVFVAQDKQPVAANIANVSSAVFDTLLLNAAFDGFLWKSGPMQQDSVSDSNVSSSNTISRNGTSYAKLNAYTDMVIDFNADTTISNAVLMIGGIVDTVNVTTGHNRVVIADFKNWTGVGGWGSASQYFRFNLYTSNSSFPRYNHLQIRFVK